MRAVRVARDASGPWLGARTAAGDPRTATDLNANDKENDPKRKEKEDDGGGERNVGAVRAGGFN